MRKHKILWVSVLLVLVGIFGFLVYINYTLDEKNDATQSVMNIVSASPTSQDLSPSPAKISPTPQTSTDITLAFCGDVVCHTGLNDDAKKSDGTYDYTPIFGDAKDIISKADYAVCTMETTFPKTTEYTGYPQFKSPPELAKAMKDIGIDLVNTASNHCMDSYKSGLISTLDVLDQNGLDHVGTYRTQEEHDKNDGILVKNINGVNIAFLSFTYGTNGLPVTGFEYVSNIFFKDYLTTLKNIDYDLLKKDMAEARSLNTNMIVVVMHWGNEYAIKPVSYQKELADFFFKEGATLVIGGHCHVPEPIELRHVVDNEGNERMGLLAYCLGNFVSCQNDRYTNLTAILKIDIQKDLDTGKTNLKNVSYTPMFMVDLGDYGLAGNFRYKLVSLHESLDDYKNGKNPGYISDKMYSAMESGLKDIHGIMDEKFDAANDGGVDVTQWAQQNSGT